MFVTHVSYYIQPKSSLQEVLNNYEPWFNEIVGPQLWRQKEDSHWSGVLEQRAAQVKLLFLAKLLSGQIRMAGNLARKDSLFNTKLTTLITELLGEPPYNTSTFDKWWEIERIRVGTDTETLKKSLFPEAIQGLEVKDQPDMQPWLDKLIKDTQEQKEK